MHYTKPPFSIEQQIELLRSRGLLIPDGDRVARYLSHISYYRLRGYWIPFEQPGTGPKHCFRQGTTFDQVLDLYIFDRKFRLLVLEAMKMNNVIFSPMKGVIKEVYVTPGMSVAKGTLLLEYK